MTESLSLSSIFLLACLLVYPFQPQHLLQLYLSSMMFLTILMSTVILIQIDKNPSISILTGTKPEDTNWPQLLKRLGLLGGLPLISLLAGQFPEVRAFLSNWLGSIFKLLM